MLQVGDVLQSWRIVGVLGRGGTAQVWEVEHAASGLRCALKVPLSLSARARSRLLREAGILAALVHPNVVRVVDLVSLPDGGLGMVMEKLEGTSLQRRLELGPISEEEALWIFQDVVAGVSAAHHRKIIHRDIKPSNVMLVREGRSAIVTDFGLGKQLDERMGLTTTGLLGSVHYMAPEQLDDPTRADQRADVFSLGCLLYELLARERAFQGDHVAVIARKARAGVWARLDVDRRIAATLEGCLEPDPSRRIPDIQTLLAVLDGHLTWRSAERPPPRAEPSSGRRPAILLTLVLPLALGAVWLASREPDAPPSRLVVAPAQVPLAPRGERQLRWFIAPEGSPAPGLVHWIASNAELRKLVFNLLNGISWSLGVYDTDGSGRPTPWPKDHAPVGAPATLRDAHWLMDDTPTTGALAIRYPAYEEGHAAVILITAGCMRGQRFGVTPGADVVELAPLAEAQIQGWFERPGIVQGAAAAGPLDVWSFAPVGPTCDPDGPPARPNVSAEMSCALDLLQSVLDAEMGYDANNDRFLVDLQDPERLAELKVTVPTECDGGVALSGSVDVRGLRFVGEATVCSGLDRGRRLQWGIRDAYPQEIARARTVDAACASPARSAAPRSADASPRG